MAIIKAINRTVNNDNSYHCLSLSTVNFVKAKRKIIDVIINASRIKTPFKVLDQVHMYGTYKDVSANFPIEACNYIY